MVRNYIILAILLIISISFACDTYIGQADIPYSASIPNQVICLSESVSLANDSDPIQLKADNTTLDCQNFGITNTGGYGFNSNGVAVNYPSASIGNTVENCIINGFDIGIQIRNLDVNILNNTIVSIGGAYGGEGLYLFTSDENTIILENNITAFVAYEVDDAAPTLNDSVVGNIYYASDSTPASAFCDITSSTNTWADGGSDLPFSTNLLCLSLGGIHWDGGSAAGEDWHPWVAPVPLPCSGGVISSLPATLNCPNSVYTLSASLSVAADNGINIIANNITVNCQNFELIGDDTSDGIYISSSDNAVVENCNIHNFFEGISLLNSNEGEITNNIISQIQDAAITLDTSNYALIANNSFITNNGFAMSDSSFNTITGNNINAITGVAFYLQSGTGESNITENNITSNVWVNDYNTIDYFNNSINGNIYYQADGTPASAFCNITSTTNTWADSGSDLPFSGIVSCLGGTYWSGVGEDYRPWVGIVPIVYHNACIGTYNCGLVVGSGPDTCSVIADCQPAPTVYPYAMTQPNVTGLAGIIAYANQIVGSPYPTFFAFGMVLIIALIIMFSLAQLFKWERALAAGSGIGLMLTLILSLGGPLVMNIYYSAIFLFFLIVGVWLVMSAKDNYQ